MDKAEKIQKMIEVVNHRNLILDISIILIFSIVLFILFGIWNKLRKDQLIRRDKTDSILSSIIEMTKIMNQRISDVEKTDEK